MKKTTFTRKTISAVAFFILAFTGSVVAQSKINVDLSGDFVSSYVWRGIYQAGTSIQPSLSASAGGFSVGAWGSTDIAGNGKKEVDFAVGYSASNFNVAVTDYWYDGEGTYNYFGGDGKSAHAFEAGLSYTLSEKFPLTVAWNTFFAGKYDKDADGDHTYSTYVEASYPFSVSNVDLSVAVGITPWKSAIYQTSGFDVTNVTIGASKEIKLSNSFSLPLFANVIFNPAHEDVHFVLGITIQ